jgi:hypothetical protein
VRRAVQLALIVNDDKGVCWKDDLAGMTLSAAAVAWYGMVVCILSVYQVIRYAGGEGMKDEIQLMPLFHLCVRLDESLS